MKLLLIFLMGNERSREKQIKHTFHHYCNFSSSWNWDSHPPKKPNKAKTEKTTSIARENFNFSNHAKKYEKLKCNLSQKMSAFPAMTNRNNKLFHGDYSRDAFLNLERWSFPGIPFCLIYLKILVLRETSGDWIQVNLITPLIKTIKTDHTKNGTERLFVIN